MFMREHEHDRKADQNMAPKCRVAYSRWQAEQAVKWHSMMQIQRNAYALQAKAEFEAKLDPEATTEVPDRIERDRLLRTVVDCIGDTRTPFRSECFEGLVRRLMSLDDCDPAPGFTAYGEMLRAKQCAGIFVKNRGAHVHFRACVICCAN